MWWCKRLDLDAAARRWRAEVGSRRGSGAGEPASAFAYWQRLLAELPPASPDRPLIEDLIEQVGAGE